MTSDVTGVDILRQRVAQSALMRALRYREEAMRLRRMAETETPEKLRRSLLSLAKQYDELALGLAPHRRRAG